MKNPNSEWQMRRLGRIAENSREYVVANSDEQSSIVTALVQYSDLDALGAIAFSADDNKFYQARCVLVY